jgi:uncharacterized membrane protein YdjX (TVP38/TMEM64 family)
MSGRRRAALLCLATAAIVAGGLAALGLWPGSELRVDVLLDRLAAHPATPAILLGLIVACGVLVAPVSGLVAVTGVLWEPMWAFVAAFAAQMTGGVLGWAAGRRLDVAALAARHPKRPVAKATTLIADHPYRASLLMRMVPGIPFALQNGVLGAAGVRLAPFLAGSALGVGGAVAVFTLSGAAGAHALRRVESAVDVAWAMQAGLVVLGVWLWFSRPRAQGGDE